jgi:predicted HicB family RNase H-like nuclease
VYRIAVAVAMGADPAGGYCGYRSSRQRFVVRTSPALHAQLVIEAAEQNVSMNQCVVQKLSGRLDQPPGGLFDFD